MPVEMRQELFKFLVLFKQNLNSKGEVVSSLLLTERRHSARKTSP